MSILFFLRPASTFSGRLLSPHRPLVLRSTPEGLPPEAAQSLVKGVLSRAQSTLSEKNKYSKGGATSEEVDLLSLTTNRNSTARTEITNQLLNSAASRSKRTLSTQREISKETPTPTNNDKTKESPIPNYNQNPAISLTALAQWLWSTVLEPHKDSAIDATCGNGNDSKGIAQILFGNPDLTIGPEQAQLICIDVQETACQNTRAALEQTRIPLGTLQKQVRIIQGSHDPLPIPDSNPQPGLVVYNLGYLPNSDKEYQTKVPSTLSSITDALLMIRLGGMVSVMTYPASNRQEDLAVRWLLEAAVVLTNKKGPTWMEFLESCPDEEIRGLLRKQLQRMENTYQERQQKRTFRVTEHKKVGLTSAPILFTATRIK